MTRITEYQGLNIVINEIQSEHYTSTIEAQNGEFIWGWEFVSDFDSAMMKAACFIDRMTGRGF